MVLQTLKEIGVPDGTSVITRKIGEVSNYYGFLEVMEFENSYYWSIDDHSYQYWQMISKRLYDSLIDFEDCSNDTDMA